MSVLHFLVGGYTEKGKTSLFQVDLDGSDSRMEISPLSAEAESPSWLLMHPNGKILYTVEEKVPVGGIAVFSFDGRRLILKQKLYTGSAPCHLALDERASSLIVSNYMDGSLDVFSLDKEGLILHKTDHVQHTGSGPDPIRQEGPHVHSALVYKDTIYAADLGLDKVFIYGLDNNGKLIPDGWIVFPDGCGPRHMTVHPDHPELMYVNSEMGGNVFVINLENREIIQETYVIPKDYHGTFRVSAVRFCENTLCIGSRDCDVITLLSLNTDGRLGSPIIYRHEQKAPRDFWINEKWCITTNAGSGSLSLLQKDGMRVKQQDTVMLPDLKPTCIIAI